MAAPGGDPRPARSRARLLDAATALLRTGGPSAVTVDAVTRHANVARATLYRHFPSANDLVAASFATLISPPPMPPDEGSLRDRILAVVAGWAQEIAEVPITLTAMAWVALGPEMPHIPDAAGDSPGVQTLRQRIAEEYSAPFTRLFDSPQAIAELEPVDRNTALALLIGPLAFGRVSTLADFDYRAVAIAAVDAFLAAYSRRPIIAASTESEGA